MMHGSMGQQHTLLKATLVAVELWAVKYRQHCCLKLQ
jgi:hypothetical protein